jgi:hypothetical protein
MRRFAPAKVAHLNDNLTGTHGACVRFLKTRASQGCGWKRAFDRPIATGLKEARQLGSASQRRRGSWRRSRANSVPAQAGVQLPLLELGFTQDSCFEKAGAVYAQVRALAK